MVLRFFPQTENKAQNVSVFNEGEIRKPPQKDSELTNPFDFAKQK